MSTVPPIDGRYQIVDRIATGGMGEVFRGRDIVLGREVAIKVLHPALAGDTAFIDRFRLEARSAALLNHPNIVAVYDWGNNDGIYFMVMELVNGHNVREILAANAKLEAQQVADIMHQTLSALAHAHHEGIVHRDIKPENILVNRDGVVKVADFGLARAYAESRVTQAPGTVTGTVQYLAPEQIQGEAADPRTDVYSLGVVGYELLTGAVPFTGETSVAVAYKHVRDRVAAPSKLERSVPKAMDHVVLWATEKDRARRPSSSELGKEVGRLEKELPRATSLAELVKDATRIDVPLPHAPTVTIPQAASGKQGKRSHKRRAGRLRRTLTWLLVLAALAGAGWAAWTYLLSAVVPQVVGLSQPNATSQLRDAGFEVKIGEGVYSSDVDRGLVAAADPAEGTRAPKWLGVTLQLSLGPRTVAVPPLIGLTLAEATTRLHAAGLERGPVSHASSADIKVDHVMAQDPAKGKANSGSTVAITLSDGPPPVAMPPVEGLTEQAAVAFLRNSKLVPVTTTKYSTTVARGKVISQSIKPGVLVPPGSKVSLVVSLGPKSFPMPDVKKMSESAAVAKLKDMGLKVNVSTVPGSTASTVVGQRPSAGSTVKAGETVTIYVGG